jgi:hypothetical protein
MRLAGSPEIYEALSRHFVSDDVPRGAAQHLAAEVMAHGEGAETSVERFQGFYEQLLAQGYSPDAAQHLAVELMEAPGGGRGGPSSQ